VTYFQERLNMAVSCVQACVARMHHVANDQDITEHAKARLLMRELAWGNANATTDLECAFAELERIEQRRQLGAAKGGPDGH
jgi:hypothetical protein